MSQEWVQTATIFSLTHLGPRPPLIRSPAQKYDLATQGAQPINNPTTPLVTPVLGFYWTEPDPSKQ